MSQSEVNLSNGARTCQVSLGYGLDRIPFRFDPERFTVLIPEDAEREPITESELSALISAPIGSPPLEDIVGRNDRVVVVVPDATRSAGVSRVAPQLFSRLLERGVPRDRISFLIGGGIHRPPFPEEIERLLGGEIAHREAIHAHLADDPAERITLGVTDRGTQVSLNRRLVETDHVVVVGGITFHYFAGFSGGRKAILPGCAAEPSIQHNHKLAFDEQTMDKRAGVASGLLEGNVVHEDMVEAVQMLNPSFLVNTVLNSDNQIVSAYAGHWYEAHLKGCAAYAAAHTAPIRAKRSLVIVSVGGWPRDMNLIQSHKAMEHASGALAEGGVMIALAECSQGLGRDDFLDWFVPGGANATALKLMENYKVNGQTAWGLRRKSERFRILLVSNLDDGIVRHMGLEPHTSLESALAASPAEPGYVMPNGLTTLPRLEERP